MLRSNKPDWIDWVSCAARETILEDMEPDGFLYDKYHQEASEVWHIYKNLPEFKAVFLDQFKVCLRHQRKQAIVCCMTSKREESMMENER